VSTLRDSNPLDIMTILNTTSMDSNTNYKTIIELIVSDLLLGKMEQGLHRLSIDTSPYSLSLSQVVFRLMGYERLEQTQVLHDRYSALCGKALETDFNVHDTKAIEVLAKDIYDTLNNEFGGLEQ
jgi:hypothetical protein